MLKQLRSQVAENYVGRFCKTWQDSWIFKIAHHKPLREAENTRMIFIRKKKRKRRKEGARDRKKEGGRGEGRRKKGKEEWRREGT